jgi:putative transposase
LIEYSTTELVENRANEYDVNRSTLWKWLKDYRENNSLMALIPKNEVGQLKNQGCHLK